MYYMLFSDFSFKLFSKGKTPTPPPPLLFFVTLLTNVQISAVKTGLIFVPMGKITADPFLVL